MFLHEKQKKYAAAIRHFTKALHLNPLIENHETIRSILIRHTKNNNPYAQPSKGD